MWYLNFLSEFVFANTSSHPNMTLSCSPKIPLEGCYCGKDILFACADKNPLHGVGDSSPWSDGSRYCSLGSVVTVAHHTVVDLCSLILSQWKYVSPFYDQDCRVLYGLHKSVMGV